MNIIMAGILTPLIYVGIPYLGWHFLGGWGLGAAIMSLIGMAVESSYGDKNGRI